MSLTLLYALTGAALKKARTVTTEHVQTARVGDHFDAAFRCRMPLQKFVGIAQCCREL